MTECKYRKILDKKYSGVKNEKSIKGKKSKKFRQNFRFDLKKLNRNAQNIAKS